MRPTLVRCRLLVVMAALATASLSVVGCEADTGSEPAANDSPSDSGDQWSDDNVRASCERAAENGTMSVDECLAAMGPEYGS